MRADSIAFAVSGMLFGVIVGWILASQQHASVPLAAPATAAAAPAANGSGRPPAAPLDEARARELTAAASNAPNDPSPRVQLGNLYFDAERYPEAVEWYEQALRLNPNDANVSTDLGVAYYYTDQADKAIAQFEQSLKVDPKHTKTMLNMGIVKAFGKQDLAGASAAWEQVIATAPNSPEAEAAKKALDGLKAAHPGGPAAGTGS
ncbi:MAG: tetratricopeptide repeat protein [Vicinamibacterales bacterium]